MCRMVRVVVLPVSSRPLKNYLRWQYSVENSLKMLIYKRKLRFFGRFRLVLPASSMFFNDLLVMRCLQCF